MRISASQNMFCPIFQVIYHKIYTYFTKNLPHFGGILCIFGEFLGENFSGDFLTKKSGVFRGIFELATLISGRKWGTMEMLIITWLREN
jgi:hypothetical protein